MQSIWKKSHFTIHIQNWCATKSLWVDFFYETHFALDTYYNEVFLWLDELMSTQFNLNDNQIDYNNSQGKVKVTDLLSRLNEERKIEKKRNLALGVAAVSAVTVFGIILTI